MPLIIAGAVALVVIVVLVRMLAHMIEAHILIWAVAGGISIPLLIFIVIAFLRGLSHHTLLSVAEIEPPKPRLQLPAPAEVQPPPVREVRKIDPWTTADGVTWQTIIEQAEREELLRSGPREARLVRFGGCEGPACREALDDRPWTLEVEGDSGKETHSFCSRECAEQWQDHDYQERAGRAGQEIR